MFAARNDMMNYCIFEREMEVPEGSETFMYDANQNLFACIASGDINDSGIILYHGRTNRMMTDSKLDLREFSVSINLFLYIFLLLVLSMPNIAIHLMMA